MVMAVSLAGQNQIAREVVVAEAVACRQWHHVHTLRTLWDMGSHLRELTGGVFDVVKPTFTVPIKHATDDADAWPEANDGVCVVTYWVDTVKRLATMRFVRFRDRVFVWNTFVCMCGGGVVLCRKLIEDRAEPYTCVSDYK